jgi:peptidoglycan/xylan/chitin deacetylase (PgdA/CDA1 family)
MKQAALFMLKALGLFSLAKRLTRRKLRILCYHGVWLGGDPHYGDCLFMDRNRFEQRMNWLSQSGYTVVSLAQALRGLDNGSLPDHAVVITIDDGWYGTYRGMVPVLAALGLPATLYVTTGYVLRGGPVLDVLIGYLVNRARPAALAHAEALCDGELACHGAPAEWVSRRAALAERLTDLAEQLPDRQSRLQFVRTLAARLDVAVEHLIRDRVFDLMTGEELRAARAAGIDIQLHTHTHRMHGLQADKVAEEIAANRAHLARILGCALEELSHLCYPSGVYSDSVFETLRRNGVRSATTTDFGLVDQATARYVLNRILDCNSSSLLELEARLSGAWQALASMRSFAVGER